MACAMHSVEADTGSDGLAHVIREVGFAAVPDVQRWAMICMWASSRHSIQIQCNHISLTSKTAPIIPEPVVKPGHDLLKTRISCHVVTMDCSVHLTHRKVDLAGRAASSSLPHPLRRRRRLTMIASTINITFDHRHSAVVSIPNPTSITCVRRTDWYSIWSGKECTATLETPIILFQRRSLTQTTLKH